VNLDTVIHLAGLDEQNSFRDIEAAWKINTLGTQSLLSVANDKGIQKFIYFSTFHVYGDCEGTITEETPAQPYHPYASTHRAAEDIVRFYQHYKNINTLTLRLSNAFGCPMDTEINRWALVFNDLCRQAMTSRKIIIKSSGKQYRNFISLHDVCAAIEHFLYAIPDQWGDGLYNLGGDNCLSIIEVAEIIAKVYKSKYGESIPVQINDKDDEKKYNPVRFNINKLKKTGFSLSGNMEKEIEKTLSLCEKFAA
jgi:UDP-glucose 4-epimerase